MIILYQRDLKAEKLFIYHFLTSKKIVNLEVREN